MGMNGSLTSGKQFRKTLLQGLISIPVFLLLLLLVSAATEREILQQGREAFWGRICLLLAGLSGALITRRSTGRKKLLYSMLSVADLGVFMIFLGFFTKTSSVINISFAYNLMILLSCGLIGFFSGNQGHNHRKRRKCDYRK